MLTRMATGDPKGTKIVTAEAGNGVVYVAVAGEVDASSAPRFGERLRQALVLGAHSVEIDLADCSFIDSSGLNALVVAYRQARDSDKGLVIIRASEPVLSVLRITGLDDLLGAPPATSARR